MNTCKKLLFLVFFYSFLIQFSSAVQLNPNPVNPNADFNILANVYYEASLEPVTDANVTYTVVSGIGIDCSVQSYPSNQKLNFVSGAQYCSGSGCGVASDDPNSPVTQGNYTICVKASKPGFRSSYAGAVLVVSTTTCGNGVVDPGENCITCPADAGCPQGQACQSDGTCKPNPPVTFCDNDGICDSKESCDCQDCYNKEDGCIRGDICDSTTKLCKCNPLPDNVCTKDTSCKPVDPDCTLPTCNPNLICEPFESCTCSDCYNQQEGCLFGNACDGYTDSCGCINSTVDGVCPLADPICSRRDPDCSANLTSIYVQGDLNYLNVYWNSTGMSQLPSSIGIACYLNCDPQISKCDVPSVKNCSYTGMPNLNICSITNPPYLYDSNNLVVCRLFDPPSNRTFGYLNTTFKPFDVDLKVSSFSVTVGQEFTLPVTVRNSGLFTDSYQVNISQHNLIFVPYPSQNTQSLIGLPLSDTQQLLFSMKVLAISETPIGMLVTANSTTNITHGKAVFIQLKAGSASLPEFDVYGVIQIILLASIAFTLLNWKKK